jgi:four helix bundle protein
MEEKANMYGHRRMVVWQNLDRIEELVQLEILKQIPKNCFQLRDQIDRSCSSSVANFIEGYYSGSIKEYLRFLSYSKRSLAELQDWVRRVFHKSFISKEKYLKFDDLSIKTIYLLNRLMNALEIKSLHSLKPSKPQKP